MDAGELEHCSTDVDFFYDWFEGRYDIDSNLCVIDEDISLSPVSDAMSVDECLHVRAMISELPEPQGEKSCIILDSGSDVSLLPMSFVADQIVLLVSTICVIVRDKSCRLLALRMPN